MKAERGVDPHLGGSEARSGMPTISGMTRAPLAYQSKRASPPIRRNLPKPRAASSKNPRPCLSLRERPRRLNLRALGRRPPTIAVFLSPRRPSPRLIFLMLHCHVTPGPRVSTTSGIQGNGSELNDRHWSTRAFSSLTYKKHLQLPLSPIPQSNRSVFLF